MHALATVVATLCLLLVSLQGQTADKINLRKARLDLVHSLTAQSASGDGRTQLQHSASTRWNAKREEHRCLAYLPLFIQAEVSLSRWALLLQLNLSGNGPIHMETYFHDDYKSSHVANEAGPSHPGSPLSIEMPLPCSSHLPQSSSRTCSGNPPGAFPTYMVCLPHSPWWFILNTSPEVFTKTWP